MKVHFLGTAAFEGIPSLFCTCATCRQARECGGKNIRSRTSVMIDVRVIPFEPMKTQTAAIVPLLADHDPLETCLLYHIEKDGKSILYGNDSGWFPEQTWAYLKDKKLDLAILECTTGRSPHRNNHMSVDAVLDTKLWMDENSVLKPGAPVIVTHFSHNAGLLHEDLTDIFEPHGIQVAYDGLIMEL